MLVSKFAFRIEFCFYQWTFAILCFPLIQDDYYWTAKDYLEDYKGDSEQFDQAIANALLNRMRNSLKGVKLIPKMRVSKAFETEGEESEIRLNAVSIEGEVYLYLTFLMERMIQMKNIKHQGSYY